MWSLTSLLRRRNSRSPCQRISNNSQDWFATIVLVRGVRPKAAISPKNSPDGMVAVRLFCKMIETSWRKTLVGASLLSETVWGAGSDFGQRRTSDSEGFFQSWARAEKMLFRRG